jgi:hypothetical protein
MNILTTSELVSALRENKGCEFATIVTDTSPAMRKTGNPFVGVRKISEINCVIGFDYSSCVNRQRTREEMEADFIAAPRQWGVRIDSKTVEHKGETYLSILPQRCLSTVYKLGDRIIDKAELAPWLNEGGHSTTQGTEKEVVYRDVKVANVRQIKFRGTVCMVA